MQLDARNGTRDRQRDERDTIMQAGFMRHHHNLARERRARRPKKLHRPSLRVPAPNIPLVAHRSEAHTSELQSLMRISYAVFCLKKTTKSNETRHATQHK